MAQRYQIAAHRQSAVTFKAELPVTPSMVPKTTAFTATKVENHAKGIGLKFPQFGKSYKNISEAEEQSGSRSIIISHYQVYRINKNGKSSGKDIHHRR